MQKITELSLDNFVGGMTKEAAVSFLRKIMGPPSREVKGLERDQVLTMLALMDSSESYNNQRYWTEVYVVGNVKYHVTSGVDWGEEDPLVEEYINE